MRISDWSSDVCSSDLIINGRTLAASHMRAVRNFADHDIDVDLRAATDDERAVDFPGLDLCRKNFNHDASALKEKQRSEEHTSELQSLMRISYAVFCLKKKQMT